MKTNHLLTRLCAAGVLSLALGLGAPVSSARADALADFNAKVDAIVKAGESTHAQPPENGPKAAAKKKIAIIPCAMAAEGCARVARAIQDASKAIGWDYVLIDPAGDPSRQTNAVLQAINTGVDGIVIVAIDSPILVSAVQQAKAAGIKVIAVNSIDPINAFDAVVPPGDFFDKDGYAAAAAAYQMAGRKLHAILMTDDEFAVIKRRTAGIEKFVADCQAAGGDCKILAKESFLVTDLQTRLPNQVVSIVRRYPDFNVLFGAYDAAVTFMVQGLELAGLTDHGFAVGWDANLPNSEIIRKDGFEKLTIGLPLEWLAYGAVDDLNRLFAGQQPVPQNAPFKLLTKATLPPSGAWQGDIDPRPAYLKSWQVK